MSVRPGGGADVSYEIRNAVWKNAVLFVLCAGLTFAGLLAAAGPKQDGWSASAGVVFFGLGAALFGFRALDRRVKISADSKGIEDHRTSYGSIEWGEIESVKAQSAKGIYYLTFFFRDPAKWLSQSASWKRWVVAKTGMAFRISMSLQNLEVDEPWFIKFVSEKIAVSATPSDSSTPPLVRPMAGKAHRSW